MDAFMQAAIAEAETGLSEGGIPIGAVLVRDGRVIGRGHNRRVQQSVPVLHAGIDCLRNAGCIGSYAGTILYSTLMPRFLCAGAKTFLEEHGVVVEDRDLSGCVEMMAACIREHPVLWDEDIGEGDGECRL
ncbi:MAG: cytosine deaminase [Methanoculleus sp. SDB]|nr:MAG: cytosine deaminase [Methanoculleus sp. SDB]